MAVLERLRRVEFSRRKYGSELLVDAAMLTSLPAFQPHREPHRLDFYDLLLVTGGNGYLEIEGESHRVRPGCLFITMPGQIRRWDTARVDGACVFFTNDFIVHALSAARVLDQCAYFRHDRASSVLSLTSAERRQFLYRFERMGEELAAVRPDASGLLAARLFELLLLINRWYLTRYPETSRQIVDTIATRFVAMVDRDFKSLQRVQDYADRLGISSGHLTVVCNRRLGRSASAQIHQRVLLEAKRMLRYTDKPAFAIAQELGFPDPAYFGRFFRRETGTTPRRFRLDA